MRRLKFKVLPECTAYRWLSQDSHTRPSGLEKLVLFSIQHNQQGLKGKTQQPGRGIKDCLVLYCWVTPTPDTEHLNTTIIFFMIQWVGNSGIWLGSQEAGAEKSPSSMASSCDIRYIFLSLAFLSLCGARPLPAAGQSHFSHGSWLQEAGSRNCQAG